MFIYFTHVISTFATKVTTISKKFAVDVKCVMNEVTFCHSRMQRGNAYSRICLSVCVCPVLALTFESLDFETLFWYLYVYRTCTPPEHLSKHQVTRSRSQRQEHT